MKSIPEGWEITTLGQVLYPVSKTYNFQNKDKIHFINTGDILEGKLQHSNLTDTSVLPGQAKKSFEWNDILFSEIRPANKRYMLVNFDCTNSVASTKLMVLRNIENADINYVYKFITSSQVLQEFQLIAESRSGTFPQITFDSISHFPIYLPPIPEQKAIAAVLSSLDDKIELLREQNKTLETIVQNIFKEWFINFNFPDENGKPYKKNGGKMIDSELGKIPEGWRMGKLGEIIELFDSKRIPLASDVRAKRKGKYPYYGATSVMDYVDDYLFDGTYLLMAEDGSVIDNQGRPIMQYVWGQFWVSNHAHVIQGKNGFSTEAIYVLLKEKNVMGIVNGAVQLKINQTNLMNFPILIPDIMHLDKFNNLLQPIFKKSKNNSEQIITLTNFRDFLLPKLMKGEIRVKKYNNL